MNCTQIYTGDDLPHLYNMASQCVWQQPENAKQEEHLDIFLVSSVKHFSADGELRGSVLAELASLSK